MLNTLRMVSCQLVIQPVDYSEAHTLIVQSTKGEGDEDESNGAVVVAYENPDDDAVAGGDGNTIQLQLTNY